MGIFERREEDEEEEAEAPAGAASPQGWFDKNQEWPVDAPSRYTHLFENSMAAVFHLEDAGKRLMEIEARAHLPGAEPDDGDRLQRVRSLEAYFLALQALELESLQIAARKATYGRLAHDLREHLKHLPEVVHYRSSRKVLDAIMGQIKDCGDPQLAAEADLTRQSIEQALEAMPEPPEYLAATSVPPQAKKAKPEPEPVPPEPEAAEEKAEGTAEADASATNASPNQDLTAEKIFRVLLEECLKDGKISQAESRAIRQIRQVLQIPIDRHRLLAESVQEDFKAGRIRGSEDMDPLTFFEKICRIALLDGVVSGAEQRLLQAMATYLHVTKEEFAAIRQRIQQNPGLETSA